MFRTILLAVDGSKYAEKAAELVAEVGKAGGDEVVVLHVTEMLPPRFPMSELDDAADKDTMELARRYATDLEAAGLTARTEFRHAAFGHVARVIIELADELDAGLIVMGSRGLSDLGALLLGSVAHKVLHLAHRPVLIVR
jgi:nucleotide-binding universal stress UspA family protein